MLEHIFFIYLNIMILVMSVTQHYIQEIPEWHYSWSDVVFFHKRKSMNHRKD